jgi:hypothetical protein
MRESSDTNTRMEKVPRDVALKALLKYAPALQPSLRPEKLKVAFPQSGRFQPATLP